MTCKVRRDFKIITDELSHVLRQFNWWHRTFCDFRFVLQNLYIRKQVRRCFKTGASKVQETPTRTFRAATIVEQVNEKQKKKKRLLFFSLKFRFWVFLFLRTPFFKTQHFGPMVQFYLIILLIICVLAKDFEFVVAGFKFLKVKAVEPFWAYACQVSLK